MRYLLLTLFLWCNLLNAQSWDDGLSSLQRHRVYPYVDRAFKMQHQQDHAGAAGQLQLALDIVPGHLPLLQLLLQAQLTDGQLQSASTTLLQIPAQNRQQPLSSWLELALRQSVLPEVLLKKMFDQLNLTEQQLLVDVVSQRLIAQHQQQQAYAWLNKLSSLPFALAVQRAVLAAEAGDSNLAAAELKTLYLQQPSAELALQYCQVLLQADQTDIARQLTNSAVDSQWATHCSRQILQRLLARQNWTEALALVSDRPRLQAGLEQAERQQLYQAALNAERYDIAGKYLAQLQLPCLRRVVMFEQLQALDDARKTFRSCSAEQGSDVWFSYAARWLNADELAAINFSDPKAIARRDALIQQKQIAVKDYAALAKSLFNRPLQLQEYNLLLTVVEGLPEKTQQANYFAQMYQVMPDAYLLDRLSAVLVELQLAEQALHYLTKALPFTDSAQRPALANRLLYLLSGLPAAQQQSILRQLASWPDFKAQRAELWRVSGDCEQAKALLAPEPDGVSGWYTMAMCETAPRPGLALQYWQHLYQLAPSPDYLRQIAYIQQQLQQPQQALHTLQQLPAEQRSDSDLQMIAILTIEAGQPEQALTLLQHWQPGSMPHQLARWQALASVYQQLQRDDESVAAWLQAYRLAPDDAQVQAGYGFAISVRAPEQALNLLQAAQQDKRYANDAAVAAQLAFLYQKMDLPGPARAAAQQAVQFGDWQPKNDTRAFALMRLDNQLLSPWRFSAGVLFSDNSSLADNSSTLGRQQKQNATLRAEYFFNPLQQNLALFVVLGSSGQQNLSDTQGTQLGLRYKPLTEHSIWLSAAVEKVPLQHASWQPQLRLSADLLNSPPRHADWHPQQPQWAERRLFTDLVWWPKTGNLLGQTRYEQGKVFSLPLQHAAAVKTYALVQFDYSELAQDTGLGTTVQQWRTGLGLSWRSWFGQALQRNVEVNLEWHYHLAGDVPGSRHGWLLQASSAW